MSHHGSGESQSVELRVCPVCQSVQAKGSSCDICGKPLTLVGANYLAGRTLGKYRIEYVLGAGGMGMVYRASHVSLNKPVALKILLPRVESGSQEFAKRFLREARVLAELHHPNIVEIYDMDITDWGTPYYVMEYLRGLSLVDVIDRFGTALPEEWVAEIAEKLVSALAFAHNRGVIHRDLKPENIFVSLFGKAAVPKILDFGIAKLLGNHENTTRLTSTGSVVGTPEYLTPEQVLNRELGGWTDQYTLALVVAEMLSGICPRAGKSLLEIVSTEIHRPLDLISIGIPADKPYGKALYRATQPDPKDRFEDVQAFLKALKLEKKPSGAAEMARWLVSTLSEIDEDEKGRESYGADTPSRYFSEPASLPDIDRHSAASKLSATRRILSVKKQNPPAAERNSHSPRHFGWKLWGGLGVLTLLILVFGWNLFKVRDIPPQHLAKKNMLMEVTRPVLSLSKRWDLPPDTKAVIGQEENNILAKGANGVYLVDNSTGKYANFPFPPRSAFLSGDGALGAFLLRGGGILHWNPKEASQKTVATGMPPLEENEKIHACKINGEQNRLLYSTDKQVRLVALEKGRAKTLFTRPTGGGDCFLAMGEELGAYSLATGDIHVFRLIDGRKIAAFHIGELRFFSIAVSESLHLVAVSGWFDKIYLLNYAHPDQKDTIPLAGKTQSLAWLGSGTTLIAGGNYGAVIWKKRDGAVIKLSVEKSGELLHIYRGEGAVLAIDAKGKLCTLHYNSIPRIAHIKLRDHSIWATAAAPSNGVFAGDSGGGLFQCNSLGVVAKYPLHTLGIAAMASDGKFLATASDDKTIAVWKLPGMQVEWRSRAHRFLVNGLWLNPKSLWSVSSDGNAKEWSWPDMEQKHLIPVASLFLEKKVACQSVWGSSDGKQVLVGTWDKGIVSFEQQGNTMNWHHFQTVAKVIYQAVRVPGMDLVAFSAFAPESAYVYDLQKTTLYKLPIFRASLMALCAGRKHEIWYYGPGNIMQYRFQRDKAGLVHFTVSGGMESALSIGISGCLTTDKQHLVTGNERGELFWWDITGLEQGLGIPVNGVLTRKVPVTDTGTLAAPLPPDSK